jgi:hypothetical protein
MTERPKAASFQLCVCDDPNCGPHIVALDEHERCMAEIVIERKDIVSFIQQCVEDEMRKELTADGDSDPDRRRA